MYKKLSASASPPDPQPGALPLDSAEGCAPKAPFRLALRALAMVHPPWQILDPPLQVLSAICQYFGCSDYILPHKHRKSNSL